MSHLASSPMASAPSNVVHMSKMIQVRNVPDEIHRALKIRAAQEGISLSDYIKRDLEELALQATIEEIGDRGRERTHGAAISTDEILADLREARDA